jgi:hypothetical protein
VQRAFPVVVENTAALEKTFRLSILNQPPPAPASGGVASFDQFALSESGQPYVDVTVPAGSMIARTVYVTSTADRAAVKVQVREEPYLDGGLRTTIFLNPDPTAPRSLLKPGETDPVFDIKKYEGHDVEIGDVFVQDINFQTVSGQGPPDSDTTPWPDAGWPDPGWKNPGWKNPGWKNPGWKNQSWEEPGWKNQTYAEPGWKNPGWKNPGVSDTDAQSGSSRYVTARVVSQGECKQGDQKCANTSSAYSASVLVAGADPSLEYQLVVYKLYTTAATGTCDHKLVGNTQVLVNIPDYQPFAANAGTLDPRATFFLAPNEVAYVVLVAFAPNARVFPAYKLPVDNVIFTATPQAVNTDKYLDWLDSCTSGGCPTPPVPTPATTKSFYIDIEAPPLPTAYVGEIYPLQTLMAVGGEGTHSWTVTGLPAGMYFPPDETGIPRIQITGAPTDVGLFTFTVQVSDKSVPPQTASQKFSLLVAARDYLSMVIADYQDVVDIESPSDPSAVPRGIEGISGFVPDLARDPVTQSFYALDYGGARVLTVGRSATDGYETLFTFSESETPELAQPVAIAADAAGSIFVADNDIDKIYRFQRIDIGDGVLAWRCTAELTLPRDAGAYLQDIRMAIDGAGNLIVAYDGAGASWATQILRVRADLQSWTEVSYSSVLRGTPVDQIPNRPVTIGGLGIDSQGNYVVADYCWNCPYTVTVPPSPTLGALGKVFVIDPSGETSRVVAEDINRYLVGNMAGLQVDPFDGSYVVAINSTDDRNPGSLRTRIVRVTPNPGNPAAAAIAVVWAGPPLIDASGVQFQLPVYIEPPVQPEPSWPMSETAMPGDSSGPPFVLPSCEANPKPSGWHWPTLWEDLVKLPRGN